MKHIRDRIAVTIGYCATCVAVVVVLPIMAFLVVTLRMVLLPVAIAVGVAALVLLFGSPRFRAWLGADWADGGR
ncbi:MAG: hypothetical protein LJF04_13055 [Gemmatimonadetes bacterium]|nr:hypothetical protein [Gemmatimonadota bacterium]